MNTSCCKIGPVFGLGLLIAAAGAVLYAARADENAESSSSVPTCGYSGETTIKGGTLFVAAPAEKDKKPDGRELFTREWLPKDARAHGGDGLGPVFNDSSCVACHNQGGVGGGGSKNVDVITAAPTPFFPGVVDGIAMPQPAFEPPQESSIIGRLFRGLFGGGDEPPPQINIPQPQQPPTAEDLKKAREDSKRELVKFHPGFATARSVVLHKFGTDAGYDDWRMRIAQGGVEGIEEDGGPAVLRKVFEAVPHFGVPQAMPLPTIEVPQGAPNGGIEAQPDIAPGFAPGRAPVNDLPANAPPRALPPVVAGAQVQTAPAVRTAPAIAVERAAHNADRAVQSNAVQGNAVAGSTVARSAVQNVGPLPARVAVTQVPPPIRIDSETPVASEPGNPGQTQQIMPDVKFGFGGFGRVGIDFGDANPAALDPLINLPRVQQLRNESQMAHPEQGVVNQIGMFQISVSHRNATALFGVGRIDAIPERVLIDLMKKQRQTDADTAGRVAKLKDGKIGRFGWKNQLASLEDFALTACAIELGLNVPGHEQAGLANKPSYKAPGLDMDKDECNELVAFLKNLPAPSERTSANDQEAAHLKAGEKLFSSVGCATCHVQNVGEVKGIYSDLLLHDMGPALGDTGSYGIFAPNSPGEEQEDDSLDQSVQNQQPAFNPLTGMPQPAPKLTTEQLDKLVGALRQEWRTPPLWGLRDSAPYLHDGRADSIEQAIAFHGGQGTKAAQRFFKLSAEERLQVISFLKSLTAPDQVAAR